MPARGPVPAESIRQLCALDPARILEAFGVVDVDGATVIPLPVGFPEAEEQTDVLVAVGDRRVIHLAFCVDHDAGVEERMRDHRRRLEDAGELAGRAVEQHLVVLGGGEPSR
jgi:hypothetical protein